MIANTPRDITIRQIEYAVAVAEYGHFGRAAESMIVSQPGLSTQIRVLERKLGTALFERTTGGVLLTAAGEVFMERGRAVLRGLDELVTAIGTHDGGLTGSLRLAVIPTMAPYLLPSAVSEIHSLWPDLKLVLSEMPTAEMVRAIEHGEIDIGLLATPYETGSLRVTELADEAFLLAVPPGHHLVDEGEVPLSILSELPTLIMEEGHCLRDHVLSACELAGATEQNEVVSASLSTLVQMVLAGAGVTLLPESAVALEQGAGSSIVTIPFESPAPGRTISLAWRRSDPRIAAFGLLSESLSEIF